jgi:predicted secreted protein
MGNLIRQYNPVQHYEALCPPEQEQETLKRMDGIVEAYVQNTAEQLRHLADQLEERYNYGYQTKRKPITV